MKFKLLLRRRAAPDASPPSRGAWIEIGYVYLKEYANEVAPLAGGVD